MHIQTASNSVMPSKGQGELTSNSQVRESGATKMEGLKRGLQTMESSDHQMSESSMFLFVRSSFVSMFNFLYQ